ncbi:LysR family transcriptional regulator [Klebsiella pneumoniae]|nr:LysR family transcriptional regulator [Klebsiella pneumoniae]
MRQSFTLQRGKISVAAMPSFAANVLPEALKAFRDRYAGVNVTVHDVINEQVIEMVREGRVGDGHRFRAITQPQPAVYPAGGGPLRGDRSPTIPAGEEKAAHLAGAVDPRLYYPAAPPRRYA